MQAARRAADPFLGIERVLELDGEHLILRRDADGPLRYDLSDIDRIVVVGAGKASARMAEAVEAVLGDRIDDGLVVVKDGHGRPTQRVRIVEAAHPIPDTRGVDAARRMIELVGSLDERALVLCLVSGGGSSLLTLPVDGVSLASKQTVTDLLLRAGATIHEINAVRKHLSAIKGGWLAHHAHPARVVTLLLSDVVGDRLDVIASGPTVPDESTFGEAEEVLRRYSLWERLPADVRSRVDRGLRGEVTETPKTDSPVFDRCVNVIIGSNVLALRACDEAARELGMHTVVLSANVEGEARHVGLERAVTARSIRTQGTPVSAPACVISGGEPTVTLRGHGKGGRNQELALAAALGIEGLDGVAIVSFGTDGTDGPTDAAGAVAFGDTVVRARALGLDVNAHLDGNDAYPLFDALDDLIRTGPTGTNVMDVHLVLVV